MIPYRLPLTSKIRIVCGNLTDTLEHVADDISFRIFYEWEQYSLNCRAGELCIGLGYRHVEKNSEIIYENVFIFENHWNTVSIFIPTQFGIEGLLKDLSGE